MGRASQFRHRCGSNVPAKGELGNNGKLNNGRERGKKEKKKNQ